MSNHESERFLTAVRDVSARMAIEVPLLWWGNMSRGGSALPTHLVDLTLGEAKELAIALELHESAVNASAQQRDKLSKDVALEWGDVAISVGAFAHQVHGGPPEKMRYSLNGAGKRSDALDLLFEYVGNMTRDIRDLELVLELLKSIGAHVGPHACLDSIEKTLNKVFSNYPPELMKLTAPDGHLMREYERAEYLQFLKQALRMIRNKVNLSKERPLRKSDWLPHVDIIELGFISPKIALDQLKSRLAATVARPAKTKGGVLLPSDEFLTHFSENTKMM